MKWLATTNKQAIARPFVTMTIPRRDRDVSNPGFPLQRYKARKPRATATKNPDTITPTVNEARSFPTVNEARWFPNEQTLSEVQNARGARGGTELDKWE